MTRDDDDGRRDGRRAPTRFRGWMPPAGPDIEGPDLGSLRDGLIDRLFELSPTLALAILFAYWMFMASTAIITFGWGSLFASLLGTLILLVLTVGLVVAYREARLRAEADEIWRLGALLLAIPTLFFVASVLLLPLMVVVVLVTYALASIPVALMS